MGPQAWMAVGRALGLAALRWGLDPRKGGAAILISQIEAHVVDHQFELARVKLQHLKRHHTELYEEFLREFGDELDLG